MITSRQNSPRQNVFLWLSQLRRSAASEKAEFTEEKIREISEPMLAMTASANSADPEKMRQLVESDGYPRQVIAYMAKEWVLNTGIEPRTQESIIRDAHRATAALKTLKDSVGTLSVLTGEAISDLIEKVADTAWRTPEGFANGQGHGTPVLIREALGLPGDHDVCAMVTDLRVVINAVRALDRLGFDIDPEAQTKLTASYPNPTMDALVAFHTLRRDEALQNALIDLNPEPELSFAESIVHDKTLSLLSTLPRTTPAYDLIEKLATWHVGLMNEKDGKTNNFRVNEVAHEVHEAGLAEIHRLFPETKPQPEYTPAP